MTRLLYCFIPVLITLPFSGKAQKVEFGGGGGPTFYKGDLHPRFRALNPGVAGNLFLRYNLNRVISAKAGFMYGVVKGDDSRSGDPYQRSRNFSFSHTVMDYSLQIEYNFLNFRTHNGRYEHDWTPYLFGGVGRTHSLSKRFDAAGNSTLPIKNESRANEIIPFGIGFKKILGPRLNISGEFSTKVFLNRRNGSMFDGIDGIQGDNFYTRLLNPSDPNYSLNINPNTKQKDKYFQASITISYLIYKVHCNDAGKNKFTLF